MVSNISTDNGDTSHKRTARYTENEVRQWIETVLKENLPNDDLFKCLKDGTILCRLLNLILPSPGVKFKRSTTPFVHMENISIFLQACELPPFNLPDHDRFCTVDLYESKDHTQVLQCLGAFSRVAHVLNPQNFKTTIGPKSTTPLPLPSFSPASNDPPPLSNGGTSRANSISGKASFKSHSCRDISYTASHQNPLNLAAGKKSGSLSNVSSPVGTRNSINPAWNFAQYGYMGGASQGNQCITFGGRRQITSTFGVNSQAERERKLAQFNIDRERKNQRAQDDDVQKKVDRDALIEEEQREEERRLAEVTEKLRLEQKELVERQKREWQEQERQWIAAEEKRYREEKEAQEKLELETKQRLEASSLKLRGQYLSEYLRENKSSPNSSRSTHSTSTTPTSASPSSTKSPMTDTASLQRIRELEKLLVEAKAREKQYLKERKERMRREAEKSHTPPASSFTV